MFHESWSDPVAYNRGPVPCLWRDLVRGRGHLWGGGGGGWHKASVFSCLPLAAPIGLSPLLILTLCGSERVCGCVGGHGQGQRSANTLHALLFDDVLFEPRVHGLGTTQCYRTKGFRHAVERR